MAITANLVGGGRRSSSDTFRSATASAACSEARVISVSASPLAARRAEDPEGPEAPPKGGLGGAAPPESICGRGAEELATADRTDGGHCGLGVVLVPLDSRHHLGAQPGQA